MRIGIFGDSYSANTENNNTKSWTDHLKEKHDVVNYSVSGSSLFFSLRLFENNHALYDKIIFVVTCPGRWLLDDNSAVREKLKLITGLRNCEFKMNTLSLSIEELTVYKAVKDYFLHVQNTQFDNYVHNLMVEEIKRKRPDVILIPSFIDSFNNVTASIRDIQAKEDKAWGVEYVQEDTRHCHMTEENNKIFASKVEKWLDGEQVNIDINDYVTPPNKEFYIR